MGFRRPAFLFSVFFAAIFSIPSLSVARNAPGAAAEDPLALMGVRLSAPPPTLPACGGPLRSACRMSVGRPDGRRLWMFNFPATPEHDAWQVLGKEESGRLVGLMLLFPDSQTASVTTLANEKWKNWRPARLVGETLVWDSLDGRAQGSFGPLNGHQALRLIEARP